MSQGSATTTTRLRAQLAQQVSPENTRSIFPGAGWVYFAPPSPPEVLAPDQLASQLEEEKGASNLLVVVALLIALIAISVAAYWIKLPPEAIGTNLATVNALNRQVIATELNMRERPSMRAPVQFILPMGTRVDVLNESQQEADGDVWIKIRVQTSEGPQVGWVDARYIR